NRHRDLAGRLGWQAAPGETFPCDAAVSRLEKTASGPATVPAPRVNFEGPHARKQNARIVRIHGDIGAARAFIDEEHPLPRFAAIGGAKDTAFGLGTIRMPERGCQHYVWIPGIDYDPPD